MKSELALGALASDDLIAGNLSGTAIDAMYLISADLVVSLREHTVGEGGIVVGVAHGDYTDAEIEEWLEATSSFSKADMVAQEQGRRKCRTIGVFGGNNTWDTLNDGKPIRVPLRFSISDGQTLKMWAYNEDTDALTTGTILEISGRIFVKDL